MARNEDHLAPIVGRLDATADPQLIEMMLEGLGFGQVGICLCDEQDNVRYRNEPFRSALFPDLPNQCVGFVDAAAAAIACGKNVKLERMPLDSFASRIKERRRAGSEAARSFYL